LLDNTAATVRVDLAWHQIKRREYMAALGDEHLIAGVALAEQRSFLFAVWSKRNKIIRARGMFSGLPNRGQVGPGSQASSDSRGGPAFLGNVSTRAHVSSDQPRQMDLIIFVVYSK
jgi:hypothetical protein